MSAPRRINKKFKEKIWRRDGYRCKICGATQNLVTAHIKPVSEAPKLKHDLNNAITLCRPCEEEHGFNLWYMVDDKFNVNMNAYIPYEYLKHEPHRA